MPSMSLMVSMFDVVVRPVLFLKRLMRQFMNKVRPSHYNYQVQRRKLEKSKNKKDSS